MPTATRRGCTAFPPRPRSSRGRAGDNSSIHGTMTTGGLRSWPVCLAQSSSSASAKLQCAEAPGESNLSHNLHLPPPPALGHHGGQVEIHDCPLPGSSAGREEEDVRTFLPYRRFPTSGRVRCFKPSPGFGVTPGSGREREASSFRFSLTAARLGHCWRPAQSH